LAVQVADGFIKLRNFWATVQEAPNDVRTITEELAYLSTLLTEISPEQQHAPTMTQGLELCHRKITVG
jgi:hypothetical protein